MRTVACVASRSFVSPPLFLRSSSSELVCGEHLLPTGNWTVLNIFQSFLEPDVTTYLRVQRLDVHLLQT